MRYEAILFDFIRRPAIQNSSVKEILIIKPSSLGDIIHGLLVAESLKAQRPDVRISWVARDIFAPLIRQCPTVDRVYEFKRHGGAACFLSLIRELRESSFDLVLDMQGLARSAVLTCFSRGKRKIGRRDGREGAGLLIREKTPLPPGYPRAHAVEILLQFLPPLGLRPEIKGKLSFTPPTSFESLKCPPGDYIMLFPDSRRPEKEWGGFRELLPRLLARFPDKNIVCCGQGEGFPDGELRDSGHFINLLGKTSLPEMAALVEKATLVVCNDSGPMHIAAALGTPVLGIFGPTDPTLYGPFPAGAPGNHVIRAPGGDLRALSPEAVFSRVEEIITGMPPASAPGKS